MLVLSCRKALPNQVVLMLQSLEELEVDALKLVECSLMDKLADEHLELKVLEVVDALSVMFPSL